MDLEIRCTIDLLPDRSSESLADWLKSHPGVQVIARDRAGFYAEGARGGAPEATQVADRWHLIKNLADVLERLFERHRRYLRTAIIEQIDRSETATRSFMGGAAKLLPDSTRTRSERHSALTRERRLDLYEQVRSLSEEGHSMRAIGRTMNLDRRTVQRFATQEPSPERAARASRRPWWIPTRASSWSAGTRAATTQPRSTAR